MATVIPDHQWDHHHHCENHAVPRVAGVPIDVEDTDTSEVVHFHRYDSKEIIYEEPKKQAKIVGEKYLKGEMLGEGSYSKVKEMLDCVLLCRRAVKIMEKKKLRWKITNGEANVQREINILKKLNHHNVIELVEVFEDSEEKKLYMVLEYCIGSLQEMLEKTPGNRFPIYQSHKYFIQLIDGLDYLHSRGVVHKDIKPGNLLLTTGEVVKITDFGVSEELSIYSQSDICTIHQGTLAFQPPEIASGQGSFHGFKADVWSAGITLFQFTTGKLPFRAETSYLLLQMIAVGIVSIPLDLPPYLQFLLKGMLAKQAEDRLSVPAIKTQLWTIAKHAKPLQEDIVNFPPYVNTDDPLRGTTVLPYLESFYNYGGSEGQEMIGPPGRWDSQDEALFESTDDNPSNMTPPISRDHNIVSRKKSSIASQGNVVFPTNKSTDELNVSPPQGFFTPPLTSKKKQKDRLKKKL